MNKRIYLIILILACRSVTSSAQTNVSGFISTNTTWNLAGSPYIVVGNTLVMTGVTLTIDPGVVVKFDSAKTIQIDGELIAIGNAASRIMFTANQPFPNIGHWGSIQFSDTCVDAVYSLNGNYLSGCTMQYCDVLYGGGNNDGAIHVTNSYPHFSNCTIAYSGSDGIHCTGAAIIVDSCAIKNCTGIGLYIYNPIGITCAWTIQNDTLEFNGGGGIFLFNASCQTGTMVATFSNNHFNANSYFGGLWIYNVYSIITHNTFEDNISTTSVENGSGLTIEGTNFLVECNLFLNNHGSYRKAAAYVEALSTPSNIIRDNIFEGNYNTTSDIGNAALYVGGNPPVQIYINNNLFRNNIEPGGSVCYLFGNIYNNQAATFYVDSNEFQNNQCQNDVYLTPGSFGPCPHIAYFTYNNFIDQSSQYAIYNSVPFGGPDLFADSNYWNSTSTQHVDSVIYDFFDNSSKTIVYYTTVLSLPVIIDTSCVPVIITEIKKVEENAPLTIFPNPASINFSIVFDKIIHSGILEIFNILGKEVLQDNIYNTSQIEINTQVISDGIYLVRLFDGERYYSKKIIVEHN